MAELLPARSLLALCSAHRELTGLEWIEFRRALLSGLWWGVCSAIFGLASWLAMNAAVVIALAEHTEHAVLAVVGVNALLAVFAAWQTTRQWRRPFFRLSQREAAHDLSALFAAVTDSRPVDADT
jgi:hypothetical protein